MIPVEHQVTCKELSQKIKELGYVQEGIWYWSVPKWCVETNEFRPNVKGYEITLIRGRLSRKSDRVFFVAPTVAELGEALPFRLRLPKNDYWLCITRLKHGGWEIRYKIWDNSSTFKIIQDDSEANCRAKMWIYLKKENLL